MQVPNMGSLAILVVGPQYPDSFAYNIAVTLASMGHNVDTVQTGRYLHMRSRWINALWRSAEQALRSLQESIYRPVVKAVSSAAYDVVLFTYGLPPEVIDSVRRVTPVTAVGRFSH